MDPSPPRPTRGVSRLVEIADIFEIYPSNAMAAALYIFLCIFAVISLTSVSAQYKPTWASLDSRPIPPWYDNAKFGIFIHWGVFSVPSFSSEWFWYHWRHNKYPQIVEFMKKNYPPGFQYADFAPMFKAEFYDPDAWADILAKSGARYIVLTSKHHEGWTNWRSNVSWNWNSVDNGPHRDLVGDLAQAIRTKTNITFGLYHSLWEWFHPLYLSDRASGFKKQDYVKEILMPEMYDLINTYKPHYLWTDGAVGPDTYWESTDFLAWLYNESPVKDVVVTNDRWCNNGCLCHHGGVYTCKDHYNPGHLVKHKWENCMKIDRQSWGYVRDSDISKYNTMPELLYQFASTVSCGGNFLLNIGPTADGRILPAFEERLLQMGEWLGVNGEAIYSTKPWRAQKDTVNPDVWFTSKAGAVYAIVLKWPDSGVLKMGAPVTTKDTHVTMLGYSNELSWEPAGEKGGIVIHIPAIPLPELPSVWAWVVKMVNIE